MTRYDWPSFLSQWQQDVAEIEDLFAYIYPPNEESLEFDEPSMSEEEIAQLEARIGCTLPSSYREYLKITGNLGVRRSTHNYVWPAERVNLWANRDWSDYKKDLWEQKFDA